VNVDQSLWYVIILSSVLLLAIFALYHSIFGKSLISRFIDKHLLKICYLISLTLVLSGSVYFII